MERMQLPIIWHWNCSQEKYPKIQVLSGKKVVKDGNIITSGGVSSGINMALYIVKQIMGESIAERTAKTIEFTIWFIQISYL